MQCSMCNKSLATVLILDLQDGSVVADHNLCSGCAESAGFVHPKAAPLKISSEILEDLIGGLKSGSSEGEGDAGPACPACGLTAAQFKASGRLGCPRCYDLFRKSLLPLLERVHDATSHRGRFPSQTATVDMTHDNMAELRSRLELAIQEEKYEEAASLRDQIRKLVNTPEVEES